MRIKSNNRQTIIKKAAARKCSRLFAYILCTMKTEMRVLTSARRRTRSGGPRPARTGAERRHRTFEPRIGLENKKERCFMHHSFLLISARRGSNPRPPPWQGGAPPLSHSRLSVVFSTTIWIIPHLIRIANNFLKIFYNFLFKTLSYTGY